MTVRSGDYGSDQMGDYRGCIVASFADAHGGREHAFDEALANARLIAAAPDLLDAAREALDALSRPGGTIDGTVAAKLAAELAKAEGRS